MSKGQAATEFLATYGWAFLVMIAVIAGIVSIDPLGMLENTNPSCSDSGLLQCEDRRVQVLSTGQVELTFTNRGSDQLTITNFSVTDQQSNSTAPCSHPNTINRGSTATITCENVSDRFVSSERTAVNYQSETYPTSRGEQYKRVEKGRVAAQVKAESPFSSAPNNPAQVFSNLKGDGTQSQPYIITNIHELQAVNQDLSSHYILGNSIDASKTKSWNAGRGFQILGSEWSTPFTGTFDGQGHSINDLFINATGMYTGLFGVSHGILKDFSLNNAHIDGEDNTGMVVGLTSSDLKNIAVSGEGSSSGAALGGITSYTYGNNSQVLTGLSFSGTLKGSSYIGGIVGIHRTGTVQDSTATATTQSGPYSGGIAGYIWEDSYTPRILRSSSTGFINGTYGIGGIAGYSEGIIEHSYSSMDIIDSKGPNPHGQTHNRFFGGLVGYLQGYGTTGIVNNSYAQGNVDGDRFVGGLLGISHYGTVHSTYATGKVTAQTSNVGGLLGHSFAANFQNGYWDINSTNQTTDKNGNSVSLPTQNMTGSNAETNMAGFDFTNTWRTTSSYPELR